MRDKFESHNSLEIPNIVEFALLFLKTSNKTRGNKSTGFNYSLINEAESSMRFKIFSLSITYNIDRSFEVVLIF